MSKRKSNKQIIDFAEAKETRKQKREILAAKKTKSGDAVKKRKNRARVFAKLYIVMILAFVVVACTIAYRVVALQMDLDKTQLENAAALEKKARMENELEHLDDPENIEQQARTRLRMVKPHDVIYVVPEDSDEEDDADEHSDRK